MNILQAFEKPDPSFRHLRQHQLDEKRRDEEEQRERRKDKQVHPVSQVNSGSHFVTKRIGFQKLKERKENNIPSTMMNNDEPARKRSKLVLPEPQISDHEMEQIVKLGKASEAARESVADGDEASQRASATLLADYSVTPGDTLRML